MAKWISLCLVLMLGFTAPASAQLYRWVDDQGNVHYSDKPNSKSATEYRPDASLSTYSNTHFLQSPQPDVSDLPPVEERLDRPDLKRLNAIRYPNNPNHGSVLAYIREIYEVSKLQKRHLVTDPQVEMLTRVGNKHLTLLIRTTNANVGWHTYGIEAIRRLATDKHKHQIFDAMKSYSKYATVVYARGWHREIPERMIDGLRNNRDFVPGDWIRAVAEFDNEDAKRVLLEYFKYGWNNHVTLKHISAQNRIPRESIRAAIPTAWETANLKNPHARGELTPHALEIGYGPAFKFVMTALAENGGKARHSMNALTLAQRYTDQTGSAAEILAWYRNNRGRIRFDQSRGLFVAN